MKSGEFIKYNKIYFSSKIVQKNGAVRLFLRLFLFFNKALSEVKASGGYPSNVHTVQSPSNWPTMKRNCIKLQTIDPEIWSILIFQESVWEQFLHYILCMNFQRNVSCVLSTDQISLSDCLFFLEYWGICVSQLFVSQVFTS